MTTRATPTPANPFGVAPGQHWESTDQRENRGGVSKWHGEDIYVLAVSLRRGIARVMTVGAWSDPAARPRDIRLDRFTPKHHYRLIERKDSQ